MIGLGTIVNVGTVLIGTTIGILLKNGLPKRFEKTVMQGLGLSTCFIGIGGTLSEVLTIQDGEIGTQHTMLIILCLALGAVIGEALNIEQRLEDFGAFCQSHFAAKGDSRFVEGFVTASLLFCVGAMAIVGALNGMFYVKLRIPSMIVTTGLALIYEAVANYIAGGVEQTLPSNLRAFGQMPWNIILALLACVAAYIFLNYTKIGTYTYAIGSNEFVAKNMGINVNKYKVLAFILSGAFLGVMAILTISYGSSMVAVTGMASMSRNFVPTMGCFFGLAFKKYGMPLQAIVIGEFVINIIFFGFIALGAPTAIQDVITGLALLIIITVTTKVTKGEIVK